MMSQTSALLRTQAGGASAAEKESWRPSHFCYCLQFVLRAAPGLQAESIAA